MTEEQLNELARKLGTQAAERLDVEATARNVVARLHEQPVRQALWIQQTWLRIAAALVLVLGGTVVAARLTSRHRLGVNPGHTSHLIADDLRDLTTDELRDVLATFDDVVSSDSVPSDTTADLHQLDPQQLRAVLRSLEG